MISKYLLAALLAWVLAQIIKYVIASINKPKSKAFKQLYLSGGMPSAHSATTTAMTVSIGLVDGIDSAVFAVSALLMAIVIYDAVMVRRSSGEQGNALIMLMNEFKSKLGKPFVAKGHNIKEVIAGLALGVFVAVFVVYVL